MNRAPLLVLAVLACQRSAAPPPVLLFAGEGTSRSDVAAIESVLSEMGVSYATASSSKLDDLTASELSAVRLLVVPGGNFESMGNHLKPATAAKIRDAVQGGVAYLGICAGAFIAGNSPYNGFNLTSGVRFPFYSAEFHGVRKAALSIARPDAPALEQYWEDGPELSGWGEAVAKYPDGKPAVAQGAVGRGWVVLSGIHAEAPASWRSGMSFATPVADDRAYAATLIGAALTRKPLPHY